MRKLIYLYVFLVSLFNVYGQSKTSALQISHLTGDFYVYKTFHKYNGKRISANAMYVITSKGVVLFDTPWDKTQFQPLLDSIKKKHNKKVVMCIATHSHEDRTGGFSYYKSKGIKTYTIKLTDEIAKKNKETRAEFRIPNDTTFKVGKHIFQIFYPGKGHAPDNIVVWFDQEKILYGGCLVKSVNATDLGYLGDANTNEWQKAILKLQVKFKNPRFVIPGHDDGTSVLSLQHTLRLLNESLVQKEAFKK